jgi:DNA-binding transcriptional regulator PaaX
MSIVQKILKAISNYPGGYRLLYDIVYDDDNKSKNRQSIKTTLSRLKKQGLIINKSGIWNITDEGKNLLEEKQNSFVKFEKKKPLQKIKKTMIVIFDIPEKKRIYRDWLRNELVGFGYELVQKSVWFGPSLPKEFVLYLEKGKIIEYIRFFKVTEKDLI